MSSFQLLPQMLLKGVVRPPRPWPRSFRGRPDEAVDVAPRRRRGGTPDRRGRHGRLGVDVVVVARAVVVATGMGDDPPVVPDGRGPPYADRLLLAAGGRSQPWLLAWYCDFRFGVKPGRQRYGQVNLLIRKIMSKSINSLFFGQIATK